VSGCRKLVILKIMGTAENPKEDTKLLKLITLIVTGR
jgi:hypothetical protein